MIMPLSIKTISNPTSSNQLTNPFNLTKIDLLTSHYPQNTTHTPWPRNLSMELPQKSKNSKQKKTYELNGKHSQKHVRYTLQQQQQQQQQHNNPLTT
jgi:hypothetical protein